MTIAVKICGITTCEDALAAVAAGADYLGFVFSESPRQIDKNTAAQITSAVKGMAQCVGVFVNAPISEITNTLNHCALDLVQLQGSESPEYCQTCPVPVIKGIHLQGRTDMDRLIAYQDQTLLFDTLVPGHAGGTGKAFDWSLLSNQALRRPFFLAGGLTPENVATAIATARPDGVDVSSGVGRTARRKDHQKMQAFVTNAKAAGRLQPAQTRSFDYQEGDHPC